MRFLRFFTSLLLMSVLLGGLTGCGGGSGTTTAQRMVTITLRWPTKSAAKSSGGNARTRVTPVGTGAVPTNAIVEIYDGVTRIGVVSYTSGVQSQSLSVPAKSLTFYANAFAATGAFDPTLYTTNPATGVLGKGAGGTTPLAATDNHPLAHAVTVQDVSQSLAVSFTLDNTIVAIELVAQNPATAPTTTLTSSAALDAPTVYLNNLVKARALDGAAVLVDPNAFSWVIDASDNLGGQRATVLPDDSDTTGSSLQLNATGLVHLIVTDSEVNSGQTVITANLAFTITPPTLAANTPKTITVNTGAASQLITSLPAYARSVTYTLSAVPLVDTLNTPPVLDTPPVNGGLTSVPLPYLVTANFATIPPTLTVPPIFATFTPSGRPLTLTVNAWSNPDGTGELLAQKVLTPLSPVNSTQDAALTSNITGFTLTPPNPTITLVNPTVPTPPANLNTASLTVTTVVNTNAPGVAIDPRTVTAISGTPTVATVAVQQDPTSGIYSLLVTAKTTGTSTITVTDAQGHTGTTKVTVVNGTGGGGLKIN